MIPCASPHAQYLLLKDEIRAAIDRVLEKGHYVLGEQVSAFEGEFAKFLGVSHFIGVANGTDAIQLTLAGLGIGPGDEVITTSHTAVATVSAIVQAGATPVLADIEPGFYTLSTEAVAAALSPRTKGVVAVHLYGQPCDLDSLQKLCHERGIALVEDCAQAHGARHRGRRLGSIGRAGCFSFYPTKNLGAIGDGGGVATNDPDLAEKIRLLRQYGWKERYVSAVHGWNSRLDELQAAILRVKLKYLESENEARRKLARIYAEELAGVGGMQLPLTRANSEHVFHLYALATEKRDALMEHLRGKDIQPLIHYPMPIHLQPGYSARVRFAALPVTEKIAREELSLPMHPYLKESDARFVAEQIKDFFA